MPIHPCTLKLQVPAVSLPGFFFCKKKPNWDISALRRSWKLIFRQHDGFISYYWFLKKIDPTHFFPLWGRVAKKWKNLKFIENPLEIQWKYHQMPIENDGFTPVFVHQGALITLETFQEVFQTNSEWSGWWKSRFSSFCVFFGDTAGTRYFKGGLISIPR